MDGNQLGRGWPPRSDDNDENQTGGVFFSWEKTPGVSFTETSAHMGGFQGNRFRTRKHSQNYLFTSAWWVAQLLHCIPRISRILVPSFSQQPLPQVISLIASQSYPLALSVRGRLDLNIPQPFRNPRKRPGNWTVLSTKTRPSEFLRQKPRPL